MLIWLNVIQFYCYYYFDLVLDFIIKNHILYIMCLIISLIYVPYYKTPAYSLLNTLNYMAKLQCKIKLRSKLNSINLHLNKITRSY